MIRLKSKEDIETLMEGGKIHAEILRTLGDFVEPGMSTLILEEEAQRLLKEKGVKPAHQHYTPAGAGRPFPDALCVSINDEIVHGIPSENIRVFTEGDLVSIDLSVKYKNLITDSAITVPVGSVDDEARELLKVGRLALERGIEAAQPGNTIGDIGAAISGVVALTSFSLAEDLAGHGVGYELHEEPFVPNSGVRGKGDRLVPGMVIAIEPMVNVGTSKIKVDRDGYTIRTKDGSRSVHFEHTVAITEKGNIILTS